MDEHERELMAQYGITAETRTVFLFEGYRYERLTDAVNYASRIRDPQPSGDASPDAGGPR